MTKKVGLIVGGNGRSAKFIEEVNRRDKGVVAGLHQARSDSDDAPPGYACSSDRISHEVPFYRSYLKHAVLQGVAVVNNPFMWSADDKLFGATSRRSSRREPEDDVLPNKDYIRRSVTRRASANLAFPLDWDAVVRDIGLPCILKDAHGGGWKGVYICRTREEFARHYNESGLLTMIVRSSSSGSSSCAACASGRRISCRSTTTQRHEVHRGPRLLTPCAPHPDHHRFTDARRRLGYDMNSIEWAVKDGVPYAIDFMNPAPDFDINSLTAEYFDWWCNTWPTW